MATKTKSWEFSGWQNNAGVALIALLRRRAFWAVTLALALFFGGRAAWRNYSPELLAHRRMTLGRENLFVSVQPNWIKSNVVDSSMRIGDLNGKSLLDPSLVSHVHDAFAVQAWVEQVVEVRKTPTGVYVSLSYRRPVAMVEIDYEGESRFQPVDAHGVLLPGNEFSKVETWNYVKLSVLEPVMQGLIEGREWPDNRIRQAAEIAAGLAPHWEEIGVYRIQLVPPSADIGGANDWPAFELHLINGDRTICRRVLWGHAPGHEAVGEANAQVKLQALLDAARQRADWVPAGSDFALQDFDFDVRGGEVVARFPRPGS
ncbi:MAG: hypothetical protein KDA83_13935 [Planctomycetales bacterium]|nr:hypothetical protein [Planctomycetales bacterium]